MRRIFTALATALVFSPVNMASAQAEAPRLLFASGFETGVKLGKQTPYYRKIYGRDQSTGYRWPIKILGASESALHPIDHDNHKAIFNRLVRTEGHNRRSTRVLYSKENYAVKGKVTQSPYEILNIKRGKSDVYIRYWMKIDGQLLRDHPRNKWRALFEFKSVDYGKGTGFRLISYVYSDNKGQPYWAFQGDLWPDRPLWEINNYDVPVPRNKWFLMEVFWHWSSGNDGRALWKVNGEVIADRHGPTAYKDKPVDFIMPFQLYGNANPKRQWVDDLEIWTGIPDKYK